MSDCPGLRVLDAASTAADPFHQEHCAGCTENAQLRTRLLQSYDDRARDLGLAYETGAQLRAHLARAKALLVVLGRNRIFLPSALVERIDAMLCELDLPDAPKEKP